MFGLPEVKIGTIPGAGGTQRLARALGKHKAMELILTGDSSSGKELERLGLVSKSLPRPEVLAEAMSLAVKIAKMSGLVTSLAKQAVLTGRCCFAHCFGSETLTLVGGSRELSPCRRDGY